jgi:putative FmdB family regulatory protein
MPLYEYECADHGVFEEAKSISRSTEDADCPTCYRSAPRIVSITALGRMDRTQVRAMERNERSRHEPQVVQREAKPATRPTLQAAHGGYPWAIGH